MILTPQQLPSSGIDNRVESIDLTPLTYSELLEYTRSKESSKSDLTSFILDYEWIKRKVSNWKSISLIDLDYIIYQLKRITISPDAEFSTEIKCSDCGTTNILYLEASNVNIPNPLRFDIRGDIFLRDQLYKFEIPTLEQFDKVLTKINRYKSLDDVRLIKLISCFPDFDSKPNVIQDLVVNASVDDIVRLATLETMYLDSTIELNYKCNKCKGGHWSISIRSLIDNVFRCLLISRRSIDTKINVRNVR